MRRFLTRRAVGYVLLTMSAVLFAALVQLRAINGPPAGEVVTPPEQFPPAAYACWDAGGVWSVEGAADVNDGQCVDDPMTDGAG